MSLFKKVLFLSIFLFFLTKNSCYAIQIFNHWPDVLDFHCLQFNQKKSKVQTHYLLSYHLWDPLILSGQLSLEKTPPWTQITPSLQALYPLLKSSSPMFGILNLQLKLDFPIYKNFHGQPHKTKKQRSTSFPRTYGTLSWENHTSFLNSFFWINYLGVTYAQSPYTYPWILTGALILQNHAPPLQYQAGLIGNSSLSRSHALNFSSLTLQGLMTYSFSEPIQGTLSIQHSLFQYNYPISWIITLQLAMSFPTKQSPEVVHPQQERPPILAKVIQINDRMSLVKINKGIQEGIYLNQRFELFEEKNQNSLKEVIALAKVLSVKSQEAILEIQKYYQAIWIHEGSFVKEVLKE